MTVRQSHKHPTLVTVIVDGFGGQKGVTPSPVQYPEHHWRLPNTDPRNEGKFLFRLHTLDIYFWTSEDANSFIDIVGKLLQQRQLEILDVPVAPSAHEQLMSPVVQKLENVAIQDPAYHNGQTKSSSSVAQSFSPPPVAGDNQAGVQTISKTEDSKSFQPLAYNPAAPPAPEVIKHREKTPPPPESEAGTGLAAAAYHDSTQSALQPSPHLQGSLSHPPYGQSTVPLGFNGLYQGQPMNPYASSSPSTGYAANPTSTRDNRTSSVSSFPPAPPLVSKAASSPYTNISAYAPPPKSPENSLVPYPNPVNASFSPPPKDPRAQPYGKDPNRPDSPTAEILGNSYVGGPQQPLQHLQPQYADYLETRRQSQQPEGGYSNYQYEQQQQHHHKHHSPKNEYDVHNQAYRPTESEAQKHKHRRPSENTGQQPGKLEQKAEKVEKGINRLFKKVEKKIG